MGGPHNNILNPLINFILSSLNFDSRCLKEQWVILIFTTQDEVSLVKYL